MVRSRMATVALLAITTIWGSTFFIIKDAIALTDPIDFLAVRFSIAAAITAALFWRRLRGLTASQWAIGLGLGAIFGLGQILGTIGLQHTSASVSGFITGTYVVIVPLLLWLVLRQKLLKLTWLAVALALAGLATLSLTGASFGGIGEFLTLLGAALFAVHIVLLDKFSGASDAISLTTVQLIGVALTTLALGAPGGYQIPAQPAVWAALLYTATAAGIVTLLLQTWAQRHIAPTTASLLMTFEPLFAALFAIWLGGEQLTLRLLLGGALIMTATVIGVLATPSADSDAEQPMPDSFDDADADLLGYQTEPAASSG